MGETTGILWTDHTFNPWIGCTKVSAGCTHCYAETQDHRWGHDRWGVGKKRERTSSANWKQPLKWNRDGLNETRRPRVFCASLADVFDSEVDPLWRNALWGLISATPALDWQLLTKRPENIHSMLPGTWGDGWPNVWLGTSVEDQAAADVRIPALLEVPARVRFLSLEPLLGPVDLLRVVRPWGEAGASAAPLSRIHWAIVGGESGGGARAFDLAWARSIRDQCAAAGVACFVKQLGAKAVSQRRCDIAACNCGGTHAHPAYGIEDSKGGDWTEWPADLRVRQFPEVTP